MTAAPTLNGSASTRERLLSHLQALAQAGKSRSQLLGEALRWNREQPCPLPDDDLPGVVCEAAPGPRLGSRASPSTVACPRPADPGLPTVNGSLPVPVREPSTPPTNNGPAQSVSFNNPPQGTVQNSGSGESVSVQQSPKGQTDSLPGESGSAQQTLRLSDSQDSQDFQRPSGLTKSRDPSGDRDRGSPEQTALAPEEEPDLVQAQRRSLRDFPWYVSWAIRQHCQRREDRAMGCSDWESELFHFVRLMRACPALRPLTARQALKRVRGALPRPSRKKDVDPWASWADLDAEDAEAAFLHHWDAIKFAAGDGPLNAALTRALQEPIDFRDEDGDRHQQAYGRFLSLAAWAQALAGPHPVALPCALVGAMLDVDSRTVSRYCQQAVRDGYLRRARPAVFAGPGREGRAAEYVFNLAAAPSVAEQAVPGTVEIWARYSPGGK